MDLCGLCTLGIYHDADLPVSMCGVIIVSYVYSGVEMEHNRCNYLCKVLNLSHGNPKHRGWVDKDLEVLGEEKLPMAQLQ